MKMQTNSLSMLDKREYLSDAMTDDLTRMFYAYLD